MKFLCKVKGCIISNCIHHENIRNKLKTNVLIRGMGGCCKVDNTNALNRGRGGW
jgi:hypothetical protein